MVNGHLSGRENHTTAIHRLLTLELIHRLFLDGPVVPSFSLPELNGVVHAT
jgi:hypothetical protein